jgi:branched-chain amino acid transport system permease protein
MLAVILDGIVGGLQLGLLAVGLTLLYGLGGVLNLAHGAIAVAAAMVAALAMNVGWPAGLAVALGLLVATGIGLFMDQTLMRPVYRMEGEGRVLLSLLLTLGTAFVIDGILGGATPTRPSRCASAAGRCRSSACGCASAASWPRRSPSWPSAG